MVQLGEEGSGFTVQFSVGCWEHPAKLAEVAEGMEVLWSGT